LDPAPTWLIKQCSAVLAPVIAVLANRSFQEARFPDGAKMAIVKPILKKLNLDPFDLNHRDQPHYSTEMAVTVVVNEVVRAVDTDKYVQWSYWT